MVIYKDIIHTWYKSYATVILILGFSLLKDHSVFCSSGILVFFFFIFYHAALNAGQSSREKVVCLPVCLSNARIVTKRKKLADILIPHKKSFTLVL